MTDSQLRKYHALRSKGYTHWTALGKVYGVIDP